MQTDMTDELTVDTAGLVAVVGTVVDLVALLGAVDTRAVAALELIRTTRQQGCGRHATHGDINVIRLNVYVKKKYLFKKPI